MERWYIAEVNRAHLGTARSARVRCYIFAEDIGDVLDRIATMPGTQKHSGGYEFPNIRPATSEEIPKIIRQIIEEARISLSKAKRDWYYDELV